jgi:hypothetical protein
MDNADWTDLVDQGGPGDPSETDEGDEASPAGAELTDALVEVAEPCTDGEAGGDESPNAESLAAHRRAVAKTVMSRRTFDFSGLAVNSSVDHVSSEHFDLSSPTPVLMLSIHGNGLTGGATLTMHVNGHARRVTRDPKTKRLVVEGFEGEELTSLTLRSDTTDTLLTSRLREPLPSEATLRCTMSTGATGGGSATVSVALAQDPACACEVGDDADAGQDGAMNAVSSAEGRNPADSDDLEDVDDLGDLEGGEPR